MATELNTNNIKQAHAPRFTPEQKEAWQKAKQLLKSGKTFVRPLHIAMSELRLEGGRKHKGPIETLPKNQTKLEQYKLALIGQQIRARVDEWKQYLNDPGSKKLYILVREDLTTSQQAVQASHCAAQFTKEHPLAPWINGTMVLLTTDKAWFRYKPNEKIITRNGEIDPFEYEFSQHVWLANYKTAWREPDQDNRITAFAYLADFRNEDIGKMRGVKLL